MFRNAQSTTRDDSRNHSVVMSKTLLFVNNTYGNDTVVTSVMRQFRECGRFVSWAISRPGKKARNHTWHTSGTLALQIFDSLNPNIRALLL